MGIDGIGKSSPPAVSPVGSDDVTRSPEARRPFEIERPKPALEVAPAAPARGPLAALHAGAIDLNGYIDLKVHEATAHLVGLPAPELLSLRAAIRDRLVTDPTLVDLVRKAAGAVPPPGDDD